ncbi:ATP-binding protein [Streptomyces sp. ISL-1]|uniref:ATP-binding protein n=1 Tax=Streptomyces sp. ISL-1 TaxID=2817657 RepID=UPI001BE50D96|nr:ATP-binding protein [Streptomyces sp. ISL-1]MBT2392112.1 ATP-binding protein [Streptomyces sp. ISL-1]
MIITSADADIGDARRATSEFVGQVWSHAAVDDVVLVVSELVTNAAKHTVGWWRLRVQVQRQRLVVDVEDSSWAPPVSRAPDLGAAGGRGWPIVQHLAGSVEVLRGSSGKTVRASWFCS